MVDSSTTVADIAARTTTPFYTTRVIVTVGDKNRAAGDTEVLTESMSGSQIKPYFDTAYITYAYANDSTPF